jgi:hypothetical protein
MLPIKKIYIDSKFKSNDSISNSNFKITLPQSITFGSNSVFYIDEVAIPHSWWTIEDFNSKLYLSIFVSANGRDQHIIELNKQIYNGSTLATEISSKLLSIGYPSTVTYNASKQTIIISIDDYDFKFLTDDELREVNWTGESYDKNNLQSANGVIKNTERTSVIHNAGNPFVSYIDLQPIRNVYIKSPNLGNYNTLGARGESDIIKKVPVTSDFNQMIFNNSIVSNDFLDCSRQTLRTLEFILTDSAGHEIPFHGSFVSFSIIFDQMDKDI